MSETIPAGGQVGLLPPILLAERASGSASAVDADAARTDGRAPRLGLRSWCRSSFRRTVESSWGAQGGWESHTKPEPAAGRVRVAANMKFCFSWQRAEGLSLHTAKLWPQW